MSSFSKELGDLINRHSIENASGTPDFILAEYISDCLHSFCTASNARDKWYGRKKVAASTSPSIISTQPEFNFTNKELTKCAH